MATITSRLKRLPLRGSCFARGCTGFSQSTGWHLQTKNRKLPYEYKEDLLHCFKSCFVREHYTLESMFSSHVFTRRNLDSFCLHKADTMILEHCQGCCAGKMLKWNLLLSACQPSGMPKSISARTSPFPACRNPPGHNCPNSNHAENTAPGLQELLQFTKLKL